MSFTLSIDPERLIRGLNKAPDTVYDEVMAEMGDQMEEVARDARRHHRFTTRSGDLERATLADVNDDMSGEVYIEDGIAVYGKYIYRGHGSWKADRYIHRAMRRRKAAIIESMSKAVDTGLKKAGF